MLEVFYFYKIKLCYKKPKISKVLGILGFFIFQRKRGEVYREAHFLISNNFFFMVPRVFLKALKSKDFPEVKNE